MSAQKRQRPELAGTGREVEQQIKFATELYRGTTPPTTASLFQRHMSLEGAA